MIVTARSYPVMNAVAVEVGVLDNHPVTGELEARNLVSLIVAAQYPRTELIDCLQELATALQQIVWTEQHF